MKRCRHLSDEDAAVEELIYADDGHAILVELAALPIEQAIELAKMEHAVVINVPMKRLKVFNHGHAVVLVDETGIDDDGIPDNAPRVLAAERGIDRLEWVSVKP